LPRDIGQELPGYRRQSFLNDYDKNDPDRDDDQERRQELSQNQSSARNQQEEQHVLAVLREDNQAIAVGEKTFFGSLRVLETVSANSCQTDMGSGG